MVPRHVRRAVLARCTRARLCVLGHAGRRHRISAKRPSGVGRPLTGAAYDVVRGPPPAPRESPMRKRDTLTAIVLVPRPDGLRPVRQRSPLTAAITLGTAGVVTALLFGVFMSVV